MKKINFGLIIITLVCAFFTIINELDKGIVIILKDLSIVFTISVPYLVKKVFKVNINEGFITCWIIFIFMAHYLGVILGWYNFFEGFDKVTHTISGFLTAYVAMLILEYKKNKDKLFGVLFMISFTWLCAGMWEVFEFTCNALFGGDAQMVLETGVDDTMWDMIVAFMGSLILSIYYLTRTLQKK